MRLDLDLAPGVFGFETTDGVVVEMESVTIVLRIHGGNDEGGGGKGVAGVGIKILVNQAGATSV
mgnify:CR=1 FL=1